MPSPVNQWDGTFLRPWHTFVYGGSSSRPSATSIEFSIDSISARAQCQFPGDTRRGGTVFPPVDLNQHCWIQGGYRDQSSAESNELLFDGFIEDDGSSYSSTALANTLSLGDRLMLTQYNLGDPSVTESPFDLVTTYDATSFDLIDITTGAATGTEQSPFYNAPDGGWTDTAIVSDLLSRSGATSDTSGIDGMGVLMCMNQALALKSSQKPADLIGQIDQATSCKTFATPTGPRRIQTTFTPSGGAAWTLREGFEILQVENKRSMKAFYNRVVVKGLQLGQYAQPLAIVQGGVNLPAVAGGSSNGLPYGRDGSSAPITYVFQSDLIQTPDHAERLAAALLQIGNRAERRISVTTNFNPYAVCGQTVSVFAPHAKIYNTVNCFVFGVKHTLDSGGAHTVWDLANYSGD